MFRRNKYSNKKVVHCGIKFDSIAESKLYDHLKVMERLNEISDIKCQDKVYLTSADILYKPDFSFTSIKDGIRVYAEMKGKKTAVWQIKRRLYVFYGPGPLQIYQMVKGRVALTETILPFVPSKRL